MKEYYSCLCGRRATQIHHKIFRSECKPLENCKFNLIPLCNECHHEIHHGHRGREINRKLKLEFQNWLEITLLENEYSAEEVSEILCISLKASERLLKPYEHIRYKYTREVVIRACMAGRIILEGD